MPPDAAILKNPMSRPDSQFLTRLDLLHKRGWTQRAIEHFLGKPDKRGSHPFLGVGGPRNLYDLARVERIEQSREFQDWQKRQRAKIGTGQTGAAAV